eukprot:12902182-Prorocentrum_lima.AAC.1
MKALAASLRVHGEHLAMLGLGSARGSCSVAASEGDTGAIAGICTAAVQHAPGDPSAQPGSPT